MRSGKLTVADALTRVRGAIARTNFYPKTNETFYPGAWTYGKGVGDASTSSHQNVRKSRAAEHILTELAEEYDVTRPNLYHEQWDTMGTRDIARTIARAINAAIVDNEQE